MPESGGMRPVADASARNGEPKVSVLILAHNHEKYIAQAIESVLAQKTDFAYEIIVGEDCSTDRTREIVLNYRRKFPQIVRTFLPESNVGMHLNFREVFGRSRGGYLAFLDGDDYWTDSGKLQIQARALDAHPETSISCHRVVVHYEDGSRPDRVLPDVSPGCYGIEDVLHCSFFQFGSVMFRRVIESLPDWHRPLHGVDVPLYATLAQYGNISLLPEAMSVYRVQSDGAWSGMSEMRQLYSIREMHRAFYDHFDPKYRPLIRERLFKCSFDIGIESFTEGHWDDCRKSLWECVTLSDFFVHLPQKFLLAVKGYGWWAFPIWRRLRPL